MMEGQLEKIILETVDVPSLPAVAGRVLQLMNDDFSSLNELEGIISKDQAFSSRLLKIANSPYYGGGKKVDSVSTAIILIGFSTMRSLVVAASLKDVHRKSGLLETRLWEHSLGVSIAASILARETKIVGAEEALVVGLIHDIGKTILNNSMPDAYSLVIERVYEDGSGFLEAEDELLGFNHCNVGGLIARKWKLPRNLEVVIEHHHADKYPMLEGDDFEALCQLVKAADALCLDMKIGISREGGISAAELEGLGLSANRLAEIREMVARTYAEQKSQMVS
jgi:putative nucleotidyltransferase with HDIG domain